MDFQAIVRDQLGLMVSWIEGGNQVTVTRDSAGRPLLARAAGSRSKPYAAEFRYDQSGRFLGVRGEFVSVMFPLLLEEAARGGGGDVTATTGPGGGNRLLAGNLPADMAQLANVVVSDGLLQSWAANGIDYVATYSDGKVATVTASDGWVQTYTWVGDVPTITVEQA